MATIVRILETFEVVFPASVIETRLVSGGPVVQSIPVPESRTVYQAGTDVRFSKRKDAQGFASVHMGKVRVLP